MALSLPQRRLLMAALAFVLAALIYPTAGFRNTLIRDAGGYLYAGQQVLRGVPPYQSIFTHKGPMPVLVSAAGVALGRLLGLEDVFGVRYLFCFLACCMVAVLALLVEHLLASRRAGLLAALIFLGFYPFTFGATAGPEPKLPMMLFLTLGLYLTSTRRWFWAGLCGALAALTWQPTAVLPAVTFLLALLAPRAERRRAALLTLAGGALPVAAVVAYFIERRALQTLLENSIMFNVLYLDRGEISLVEHFLGPARMIFSKYQTMMFPIIIGLAGMAGIYVWRIRGYRAWRDLAGDPFAPLLLLLPAPILWSLKDFQGAPDFFIFLPFVALGLAWLLDGGLRRLERAVAGRFWRIALIAGVCLILLGLAALQNRARRDWGLEYQMKGAAQIMARFGPGLRVFARGVPQVLALTHTVSPTPYMNLSYVFDVQESRMPGGFAGWLGQIEAWDPHIIPVEHIAGIHAQEFQAWLDARYIPEQIGPWKVYVKR